ncbi:C13 family peptidase [Nitrosomonas sp. sh817]|uniref:C13 family peptidase n=1 Tax=Nitrosomonas sp. sh817 TaxID=3070658 RepID=UPI0027DCC0B1|nr:C13 family peptidase [Nitrosomonas sp. sh817]WMJ07904.1 C13 family peptidase [Nitrosomonas sp. sh817]
MDLYAGIAKESKQSTLVRESQSLIQNLFCGIRLLGFRRNAIAQAIATHNQLALLVVFYSLTALAISYSLTSEPTFDLFGLSYLGVELLIVLMVGFVVTKVTHNRDHLLLFLVLAYSVLPFLYLISFVALPQLPDDYLETGYTIYAVWSFLVCFFLALQLLDFHKIRALLLAVFWMSATYPLVNMPFSFWYEDFDYSNVMDAYSNADLSYINQEDVYYSQYRLLNNALSAVEPGKEGVTDLFFVGFGSDAAQDVFMREVGHVQRAMNKNLGASGRSVVLINNLKTIDTTPLASASNLRIALSHVGGKMNREEDVVFLYLTSHGSSDHELSVNMWPLELNDVRPEDIKAYLDDAGIRWRIILISACYSGGFIDALRDDHSLILTAAAADKASFGCTHENEYTYFGEALFRSLDDRPYQFIENFSEAIEKIRQRELSENLTPSEPQLFIGDSMREKLKLLEQDMVRYAPERFAAY